MSSRRLENLKYGLRELYELGARRAAFRFKWEVRQRLPHWHEPFPDASLTLGSPVPLALPSANVVATFIETVLSAEAQASLQQRAVDAQAGEIRMFSAWSASVGHPPAWSVDPVTGYAWDSADFSANAHDVKFVWELGRFPHAYDIARAALLRPEFAPAAATKLRQDVADFLAANPVGQGVHWASGQEVAMRLAAIWFADTVLSALNGEPCLGQRLTRLAIDSARYIERHIDYARFAVYNNHLLWEALGLYAAATCVSPSAESDKWRDQGKALLVEQSIRQFYSDGGYIQQSHNYHRVALQALLWACLVARTGGEEPPAEWHAALRRSVDFLFSQQNEPDGRLPNFGANDGALPSILTECDYEDFRPVLQAAAVESGMGRLYEPGPWDEEALWFCEPAYRAARFRPAHRASRSFETSGMHALRSTGDTFATLRCGTLLDRFSQIDMLHLDVWWRGHNVLVDAGTYRYNGVREWHNHFMRTASHNTVSVDGRDQMVHVRQFKCLYPTQARLLRSEERDGWALMVGEHHGYRRHPGACVHRRSLLAIGADLWVVVDRIEGTGRHLLRLHWLGGNFSWTPPAFANGIELRTPVGVFAVHVYDAELRPLAGDVVAGEDDPPRGWLSRHYGQKSPVPSFAARVDALLPCTFVTILAGCAYELDSADGRLLVRTPAVTCGFEMRDGVIADVHAA